MVKQKPEVKTYDGVLESRTDGVDLFFSETSHDTS